MYSQLKETGVAPLHIEDTNRFKECVKLNGWKMQKKGKFGRSKKSY